MLLPNSANNFRQYMPKPIDITIFLEPVSKYEMRSILSNLDPKKGSGSDQISSKLLLAIADLMVQPLEFLFNLSISCGIVSSILIFNLIYI